MAEPVPTCVKIYLHQTCILIIPFNAELSNLVLNQTLQKYPQLTKGQKDKNLIKK